MKKLELLKRFSLVMPELQKIAHQLHHQDENACNYGLTSRQEKRVEKLEDRADKIAKKFGLTIYHQGDPRGGTLYLIEKGQQDNYYYGIYIT